MTRARPKPVDAAVHDLAAAGSAALAGPGDTLSFALVRHAIAARLGDAVLAPEACAGAEAHTRAAVPRPVAGPGAP